MTRLSGFPLSTVDSNFSCTDENFRKLSGVAKRSGAGGHAPSVRWVRRAERDGKARTTKANLVLELQPLSGPVLLTLRVGNYKHQESLFRSTKKGITSQKPNKTIFIPHNVREIIKTIQSSTSDICSRKN